MNKHERISHYEPKTANQMEAALLATLPRDCDEWTIQDTQRYTDEMVNILRQRESELKYTIDRVTAQLESAKRELMLMKAARKGTRVLKLEP